MGKKWRLLFKDVKLIHGLIEVALPTDFRDINIASSAGAIRSAELNTLLPRKQRKTKQLTTKSGLVEREPVVFMEHFEGVFNATRTSVTAIVEKCRAGCAELLTKLRGCARNLDLVPTLCDVQRDLGLSIRGKLSVKPCWDRSSFMRLLPN